MPTQNHLRPQRPEPCPEPGRRLAGGYPSLHDLSPRISTVDWLWPAWIPRGMLTLLGAAPGVGKSLVALDLARRVIHGLPFPDAQVLSAAEAPAPRVRSVAGGSIAGATHGGAPVLCPDSNVLIVDAEGVPALLKQRAQAWDIDARRLFLMLGQGPANYIDLASKQQQILLMNMIADLRPALVIIDSLAAATSRGETSLHGARDILGFLATVARKGHLPLLIIHHLRKRSPKQAAGTRRAFQVVADDLRGSSHISAAARSVLALSRVPRPPTHPAQIQIGGEGSPPGDDGAPIHDIRRLEVIKTNLCRTPPPLGLIFEGESQAVPTLRYTEWMEPPSPPTQLDLCGRWLLQFLAHAGHPLKPALIVQAAATEGFPRRTLYRARRALAGQVIDLGNSPRDPHKRWALPHSLAEKGSPPEEGPEPHPQGEGTPPHSGTVAQ